MKYTFTFFLFCSLTLAGFGQVDINPNVIYLESMGEDVKVIPEITNNTSEPLNIYWKFEKGANFPKEWDVSIWDSVICYAPEEYQSHVLLPNKMEAGFTFNIRVNGYTHGVAGSGYIILRLFDDENFENEVASSDPPNFTSIHPENLGNIVLYPNPSSDFIGIKSDKNVKSIEVVNYVGQTVINVKHENNELHSVSHIPNGTYHVVLRNEKNEVVKILNFSKA